MEGHSGYWKTYLSCTYRIRGDIPSWITFLFAAYSLNLEPEPFFTIRSSSDHPRSRTRPKAQYIIWAINPTQHNVVYIQEFRIAFGFRVKRNYNEI